MVAHLAADAIRFRTSRTFLGESFTVGTISEALAGDQRNNYVLHVAVPPDRSDAVTDRILFDGRSFSHGEAHCWCWADQRNGSALLVRRLNRIAFSDPFPFSAGRADLDTPVQEASLEIRLPGWNRLEEAWAGDTALASGTAGPLGSTRFAFRVGTVWAGFRLAAAEAGWELAADEQGLILRHRFWQRDRKTAKTVALLAEAGEASPGAADFAAFRANLAAGRFDTAPGCFRFERDGLTLAVELEPFG